jgi:hypothetical protein
MDHRNNDQDGATCKTVALSGIAPAFRKPTRQSALLLRCRPTDAARVIQPRGVVANSGTRRPHGLYLLRRAVHDIAVECERLLEPDEITVAPAGKHRGLKFVEAAIGEELFASPIQAISRMSEFPRKRRRFASPDKGPGFVLTAQGQAKANSVGLPA